MKRGRKPTGRALSGAERQVRYRDRQNAKLAAIPDDPLVAGLPGFEIFGALPTLNDVLKHTRDDARLSAEVVAEFTESTAALAATESEE